MSVKWIIYRFIRLIQFRLILLPNSFSSVDFALRAKAPCRLSGDDQRIPDYFYFCGFPNAICGPPFATCHSIPDRAIVNHCHRQTRRNKVVKINWKFFFHRKFRRTHFIKSFISTLYVFIRRKNGKKNSSKINFVWSFCDFPIRRSISPLHGIRSIIKYWFVEMKWGKQ